jgi:hypothetical protein
VDVEDIQEVCTNRSNYAGASLLLERIHLKHRNWYVVFIEALQEADMNEVAMNLQIPALLPDSAQYFMETGKLHFI